MTCCTYGCSSGSDTRPTTGSGLGGAQGSSGSYRTSWIGNTWPGGEPGKPGVKHMQNDITALFTAPDGACFTNSPWDEAGYEASVYRAGDFEARFDDLHGFGRIGGNAIAANETFVYVALSQDGCDGANKDVNVNGLRQYPDCGTVWHAVRRYQRSDHGVSTFSTGYGWDGSLLTIESLPASAPSPIRGLAADANRLFVADDIEGGKIKQYDATSMALVREWPSPRPHSMALDGSGALWVIQRGTAGEAPKVLQYVISDTGAQKAKEISFTSGVRPTGIAFDAVKNRILVADNGPDQNIKIYEIDRLSNSPTTVDGTFGEPLGLFSASGGKASGAFGDLRFNGLSGVGIDKKGNIYVSQNGAGNHPGDPRYMSTMLESYTAEGKLNWRAMGLLFVDSLEVDPGSEQDVYSTNERFRLDYTKTSPGSEWSYAGQTLDRFLYPQDPRLFVFATAPFVRRIEGQPFLFMNTGQGAEDLAIYRFDRKAHGEIAIPCGYWSQRHNKDLIPWAAVQPAAGEWLWRDKNGDGSAQKEEFEQPSTPGQDAPDKWGIWVDGSGDIWLGFPTQGIRRFKRQGLDEHGCPAYGYTAAESVATPAEITELQRVSYFPETDTMYLGGFTKEHPNDGSWGLSGKVLYRYDDWSSSRKVHANYPIVLPYDTKTSPKLLPKEFAVAGDYIFSVDVESAAVTVFHRDTGKQVARLSPGAEVGSYTGWVDMIRGITAHARANGEYIILVEEVLMGKNIMYRWTPGSVSR